MLFFVEGVEGAPQALEVLADVGLKEARLVGILLSVLAFLVLGAIAVGPDRIIIMKDAVLGRRRSGTAPSNSGVTTRPQLLPPAGPGDALMNALRKSKQEQREPVVTRLRTIADRVEVHVDARQVEQPRWEPTVFEEALGSIANPKKAEHYRELASYRQETIALYVKGDRAEALSTLDEAMRLLGGEDASMREVVRMPDGIPQLTLIPDVLRKVASELAAKDEPQPVAG